MTAPVSNSLSARMMRGDLFRKECRSRDVMRRMTSRWGTFIVIVLQDGPYRFSDLRRKIHGISERMLSQTLQWLEGDGLVVRHDFREVPPHVEYSLTPLGREGAVKIAALADWIEENVGYLTKQSPSDDERFPSGGK